MSFTLSIVVPCYNEYEVIKTSINQLLTNLVALIDKEIINKDSYILCIDDGSSDGTWNVIEELSANPMVRGIKLSRNVGHQNALLAGLTESLNSDAQAAISIDADLQDDTNILEEMIHEYSKGNEIVYGVRNDRTSDSYLKRKSASLFYDLMQKSETSVIPHHSDFRLMSRKAIENLLEFDERNLFLRGIVPLIGLKSAYVYYERKERKAGKSKYPLMKMISFAIEGITSFSVRPIRMIFILGLAFLIITLTVSIYVIISILLGRNIPGWASIMLSIWFIGSLVLISLGIIGEYVSKIYLEVKHRPRYFIEKKTF